MEMKNYFKRISCAMILCGSLITAKAQVSVNEYSCSNISTITDNFGDTPDWIELYNGGPAAVSLTGYSLSDKISNPTKWSFPAGINIASHAYLLVWCSGKNVVVGTNIHTNFSFNQTKPDELVFTNPSGTTLYSTTLHPTQTGHSRGKLTDGGSTSGVFFTPTPGTSNSGGLSDYATKPTMSVNAGFYSSGQTVTITSPDAGVLIHYTTDGTTPTTSSSTYSAPISVSSTTVLRARAFSADPNIPASFVKSNTYFINASHTVAVVSIFGDQVMTLMTGTEIEPETGLQYFDASKNLKADTDGESNKHGNDSWSYPQRGIDFISKDEFGYNYAVNNKLFVNKSRDSFKRIILKSAANDNYPFESGGAHIRDSYVHTLSQRGNLHLDERTWSPCILYVNGQYWGVYDLREKVDDNDFTDYYYHQDEPYLEYLQTWGSTWEAYTPTAGAANTDWNTIRSYITSNSMAIQANYDHVDSILNVKSLVDYIVLNSWAVTSDWLNWNTAWWRGLDPGGQEKKWRYTLWDNDATFGHYINYTGIPSQAPTADPCNPENLGDPGGQGHIEVLDALMANPGFKQYYEARYIDLMNTTLGCDYALPLLDSMIAKIQPEMPGQIAKWGGSMSVWQTNVAAMRDFIDQRCVDINQGMVNCYSLTGPYAIKYDVSPVGAGNIKINSITPANYTFIGNYFGGIVTLLKATPVSGDWTFDHWTFDNHIPSPNVHSDTVSVTYTQADHVVAVFRKTIPEVEVGVPTAFSPNDDGNNDVLYILGNLTDIDFQIYNRWGQAIFETKDVTKGWDGTYNGEKLNPAVFAYHLTGKGPMGETVDRKGNITLVR
ncbi:MAG: Spore coat protein CotH [Bacteroidetes bacterium]|nr:Spore coat protein CotH [Bacteroidota bacterium]